MNLSSKYCSRKKIIIIQVFFISQNIKTLYVSSLLFDFFSKAILKILLKNK